MTEWTKEVPTEAGWYWIQPKDSSRRARCEYWSEHALGRTFFTRAVEWWSNFDVSPPRPPVEYTDEDVAEALLAAARDGFRVWGWEHEENGRGLVLPDGTIADFRESLSCWVGAAKEALEKGWYVPKRLRGEG